VSIAQNLPKTISDSKWNKAMQKEMRVLHKNNTWELVKLSSKKKAVGCKWVFIAKHKADGSMERYRPVAKGFTQTYGIDYKETFSPILKDEFYSSRTFFSRELRLAT
jgi:hypothetical protein